MTLATQADTQEDIKAVTEKSQGDKVSVIEHQASSEIACSSGLTLYESVMSAMDAYFLHLDGESSTDVYNMVISQVESALLASMLKHLNGNQSKVAKCLGMSRGTLLKKLTQYKLHPSKKRG